MRAEAERDFTPALYLACKIPHDMPESFAP
jgi:hypothetical protein